MVHGSGVSAGNKHLTTRGNQKPEPEPETKTIRWSRSTVIRWKNPRMVRVACARKICSKSHAGWSVIQGENLEITNQRSSEYADEQSLFISTYEPNLALEKRR